MADPITEKFKDSEEADSYKAQFISSLNSFVGMKPIIDSYKARIGNIVWDSLKESALKQIKEFEEADSYYQFRIMTVFILASSLASSSIDIAEQELLSYVLMDFITE